MEFQEIKIVEESSESNNLETNANKAVEIEIFTEGYQHLCKNDTILDTTLYTFAKE